VKLATFLIENSVPPGAPVAAAPDIVKPPPDSGVNVVLVSTELMVISGAPVVALVP